VRSANSIPQARFLRAIRLVLGPGPQRRNDTPCCECTDCRYDAGHNDARNRGEEELSQETSHRNAVTERGSRRRSRAMLRESRSHRRTGGAGPSIAAPYGVREGRPLLRADVLRPRDSTGSTARLLGATHSPPIVCPPRTPIGVRLVSLRAPRRSCSSPYRVSSEAATHSCPKVLGECAGPA